ncbi:unnamed protein product [Dovyalis caffra]|uniref:Uncharacterized protein n=1 Tax=Dovyalis caffra TaxID=77055 RepID=A0AAV1S7V0_9ROSI|nr:unnamed protein product [Dovyalis caffra]
MALLIGYLYHQIKAIEDRLLRTWWGTKRVGYIAVEDVNEEFVPYVKAKGVELWDLPHVVPRHVSNELLQRNRRERAPLSDKMPRS